MSCSSPVNTYTNSKYLYRGVSRWKQSFECGRCSGCISRHRTDWRVRSYYESRDCLSNGGFVLFDTLTYKDDSIKKYSDLFPDMNIPQLLDKTSFCRQDVQKFFKRLRINLKRAGYHYDSWQLRYILTSEYGSDKKVNGFQRTHRPHYHVLFFVRFQIDPLEFSRHVSRAWYLGKTDGVRPCDDCNDCSLKSYCKGRCLYQSSQYVVRERLIKSDFLQNCMKCVNYVTKYVSKDMYIGSQLQNNVDTLWQYLNPFYRVDLLSYRQYRKFCSQVLPFHLQSQGFGKALLDDDSEIQYIERYNKVHLPTSDRKVVRAVAVPRYYQRKLYYDYEKVDGRVRWFLTEKGVNSRVNQLDRRLFQFKEDYMCFDNSLSAEKLHQLSIYYLIYCGTLTDYQSLMLPYKSFYRKLLTPHQVDEVPLYYNRNTINDRLTIGRFVSTCYFVNSDGEMLYRGKQLHKEFHPYDGYVVVNDKVCPYWSGFDRLIASYEKWKRGVSCSRDALQFEQDKRNDYHRQIGLLPK